MVDDGFADTVTELDYVSSVSTKAVQTEAGEQELFLVELVSSHPDDEVVSKEVKSVFARFVPDENVPLCFYHDGTVYLREGVQDSSEEERSFSPQEFKVSTD